MRQRGWLEPVIPPWASERRGGSNRSRGSRSSSGGGSNRSRASCARVRWRSRPLDGELREGRVAVATVQRLLITRDGVVATGRGLGLGQGDRFNLGSIVPRRGGRPPGEWGWSRWVRGGGARR